MKIKILHITKMKSLSGSENHLLTLFSEMDKQRFEIHLCLLAEQQHLPFLAGYKRDLEQVGITVSILVIRKYINLPLIWTLRRHILQEQFQIVHTHLMHADVYGTLAAKLAGVRMIISSRHNDDRFRRNRIVVLVNRLLARWDARIIVISDWVGKFLQEVEGIPIEKIERIYYGLEPQLLESQSDPGFVRQEFRIPDGMPIIGTIGRLSEQKGQSYLLQASQLIRKQIPDFRLIIVGKGELEASLRAQVKALELESQVIFTGYREDALKLLSGFDLFVFPSLWEGFGLVLLEAMAFKKPIVASGVSAIPESVVDGRTGILVPPKDVRALADAIVRLLKDQELRKTMGETGYRHLRESFSVQKMVKRTEQVYTSLVLDNH